MSGQLSSDTVDACHVTTGQDTPPSLEGGVLVLSALLVDSVGGAISGSDAAVDRGAVRRVRVQQNDSVCSKTAKRGGMI